MAYHNFQLRISNRDRFLLDLVRNQLGSGYMHQQKPKDCWELEAVGRSAIDLLRSMLPYLVVKRNLAWIALCADERWPAHGATDTMGRFRANMITTEDIETREAIHDVVAKINSLKPRYHA